jgi:hypothetical protein
VPGSRRKFKRAIDWAELSQSADFLQLLCDLIAEGQTLQDVAASTQAGYHRVYSWLRDDPKRWRAYKQAREARAEIARDKIEQLARDIESERITPSSGKAALMAYSWLAEKGGGHDSLYSQVQPGQSLTVNNNTLNVTDGKAEHLQALRLVNAKAYPKDIYSIGKDTFNVLEHNPEGMTEDIQSSTASSTASSTVSSTASSTVSSTVNSTASSTDGEWLLEGSEGSALSTSHAPQGLQLPDPGHAFRGFKLAVTSRKRGAVDG